MIRPACHVIYTIPLPLRYDPGFTDAIANFRICDLPNFKVNSRSGDPYPAGRERLAQVIQRRVAHYVTAANPVFTPQAAGVLVEKSGGLLRDLIRLCQTACRGAFREAVDRVDGRLAEAAVRALTREQAGNLLSVHWEVLHEVHRTKRLSDRVAELPEGGEIRRVVVCHQLLEGRHILAYANDETWFDAHPFLLADLAR